MKRPKRRNRTTWHLSIGGRPACGCEGKSRHRVVERLSAVTCPTCRKIVR